MAKRIYRSCYSCDDVHIYSNGRDRMITCELNKETFQLTQGTSYPKNCPKIVRKTKKEKV